MWWWTLNVTSTSILHSLLPNCAILKHSILYIFVAPSCVALLRTNAVLHGVLRIIFSLEFMVMQKTAVHLSIHKFSLYVTENNSFCNTSWGNNSMLLRTFTKHLNTVISTCWFAKWHSSLYLWSAMGLKQLPLFLVIRVLLVVTFVCLFVCFRRQEVTKRVNEAAKRQALLSAILLTKLVSIFLCLWALIGKTKTVWC